MRRRSRVRIAILAAIAGGGLLGAVARYALTTVWPTPADRFPWAACSW
jgi:CrcB protein